jgi:hypothetical protein
MMRPSVAWPTGTAMAAPVLSTGMPRRRPSVEPMRDGADHAVAELLLHLEVSQLRRALVAVSSSTSAS